MRKYNARMETVREAIEDIRDTLYDGIFSSRGWIYREMVSLLPAFRLIVSIIQR